MKKYIFNAEKAIRNGASFCWAKYCDGKEVIEGKIGDTDYICYGEKYLHGWCDVYDFNDPETNYDVLRSNSALLEKIATDAGLPYDLVESNAIIASAAIHYYDCTDVSCFNCPFSGTVCRSAQCIENILEWLNAPAQKRD